MHFSGDGSSILVDTEYGWSRYSCDPFVSGFEDGAVGEEERPFPSLSYALAEGSLECTPWSEWKGGETCMPSSQSCMRWR